MSGLSPHVNDKRNAPVSVNIHEEVSDKQKRTYCTQVSNKPCFKLFPGLK